MPAERLRAAVVGAGLMGRWHAHAIRRAGASVAAVVDPNPARAGTLANSTRARAYDQLEPALSIVDVVHVCTPTASHAGIIESALARGCDVVVEKPLTGSYAETAHLYALAASHGRMLCPVHQFVMQRGVVSIMRRRSVLGAIRHVDFTICSAGGHGADVEKSRIAWDIVPHPLSLIARFFGCSAGVHWHTTSIPAPGELRCTGQVADASIAILISLSGRPPVNEIRIVGTAATAYVDLFHGFAAIDRARTGRAGKLAHPFTRATRVLARASANLFGRAIRMEAAYPGLDGLVEDFYAAARGDRRPPISPEEALAVAAGRERLRELAVVAETGQPAAVR